MMQSADTTPSSSATAFTSTATQAAVQPAAAERKPAVSEAEKREVMIRLAAYSFYERRGLVAGHELEDWLQAEMEVDRQLAASNGPVTNQPAEANAAAAKEPAARQ